MAEERRKFDPDFRAGAVRIVKESGRPIAQVARELSRDGSYAVPLTRGEQNLEEGPCHHLVAQQPAPRIKIDLSRAGAPSRSWPIASAVEVAQFAEVHRPDVPMSLS